MNFPKQKPSTMPVHRYAPFIPVELPDRTWPSKKMVKAPQWCSGDHWNAWAYLGPYESEGIFGQWSCSQPFKYQDHHYG